MNEDQLKALRIRILLPWAVLRGSTVWAPWGKSGWSAVVIKTTSRKWAKGMRVKPHNEKETAQGRVPMERLIKRDPKLKGKDRPELTPDEIFAKPDKAPVEEPPEDYSSTPAAWANTRDAGTHRETPEQKHRRLHPPGWKPDSEMTQEEIAARNESIRKLLDLIDDNSTTDDW